MLKPISSAGRTPMNSASDRFTRSTWKCSSWTTMKSEMESKISAHWRLDCVIRVNKREFSSATEACTISACCSELHADILHAVAGDLEVRMLLRELGESGVQLALQLALRLGAIKTDALDLVALGQSQDGGLGADHRGHAFGKVLHKIGQTQRRAQVQGHLHQVFGALAVLIGEMQVVCGLEGDGDLGAQNAGAAHIVGRDAGVVLAVQQSEQAQRTAGSGGQRYSQVLLQAGFPAQQLGLLIRRKLAQVFADLGIAGFER